MDFLELQRTFIFPFFILMVIQNIPWQGSLLKKSFFSDLPKFAELALVPAQELRHWLHPGV